jgi:capsular polysaccharide biosynthesis protein
LPMLLLLALLGALGGHIAGRQIDPMYQATTSLLVGDVTDALHVNKENIETSVSLASTYGALIRSQPVLEPVINRLGLETSWQELKDRVHVTLSEIQSASITVSVRASSPELARATAAAVADRTVELAPERSDTGALPLASRQALALQSAVERAETRIQRLEAQGSRSLEARAALRAVIREQVDLIELWRQNLGLIRTLSGQVSPNTVRVIDGAEVSTVPFRPKRTLFTALGVAAALSLGCGIVYALPRRRTARGGLAAIDPWLAELREA